jgi:hypothetical protein
MIGEKRGDPSYKERRAAAPLWILDGNLNFKWHWCLAAGKQWTDLNYVQLERNNWRFNGWMILKFELGIPNTRMHNVSKLQLDPTVQLGDMGLQSGLICTGPMSKSLLVLIWISSFIHFYFLCSFSSCYLLFSLFAIGNLQIQKLNK